MHGDYEVYGSLPSDRYIWHQSRIVSRHPAESLLN
jgi:hypothetical protein